MISGGATMREFDHIGLTTTEIQPNEMYVESTKVWVTNPAENPQMVEYLRYEHDSPVTGPMRELPHIAFRVDDLDKEMEGEEVVLGPFNATDTVRVVFILKDGVIFEFMESSEGKDWHKSTDS
jgi:catechol 2,3-dioxygenase-like lactoylglutathione lyase family enzyme